MTLENNISFTRYVCTLLFYQMDLTRFGDASPELQLIDTTTPFRHALPESWGGRQGRHVTNVQFKDGTPIFIIFLCQRGFVRVSFDYLLCFALRLIILE